MYIFFRSFQCKIINQNTQQVIMLVVRLTSQLIYTLAVADHHHLRRRRSESGTCVFFVLLGLRFTISPNGTICTIFVWWWTNYRGFLPALLGYCFFLWGCLFWARNVRSFDIFYFFYLFCDTIWFLPCSFYSFFKIIFEKI